MMLILEKSRIHRQRYRGVTLIELLIVIIIMGLVLSVAFGTSYYYRAIQSKLKLEETSNWVSYLRQLSHYTCDINIESKHGYIVATYLSSCRDKFPAIKYNQILISNEIAFSPELPWTIAYKSITSENGNSDSVFQILSREYSISINHELLIHKL